MSQPDVQIVVEERISDRELSEKFEEYLDLKFGDIYICEQCDKVFHEYQSHYCPRCDSTQLTPITDINHVVL